MVLERLTPRERILITLAHEKPDRTPTFLWARREIFDQLMDHFHVQSQADVCQALGVDWFRVADIAVHFPPYQEQKLVTLQGESPSAGNWVILHQDGTFEDTWGVRWRVGENGKYDQHIQGPLKDARLDDYELPTADRLGGVVQARKTVEPYKAEWFAIGTVENPFKRAWLLRGFENFLADLCLNSDFTEELLDRLFELATEQARRLTTAGVDAIMFIGDIAMQDRMIISPELWRQYFKPRMAGIMEATWQINPNLLWAVHSDGNIWDVLDDHIEIGFTIVNPIQPECMDPASVKRRYGKRITLHGCGTCQGLSRMSTPEITNHVRNIIRDCGSNGGLILGPSNVVQYDVPIGNVLAFYEAARAISP